MDPEKDLEVLRRNLLRGIAAGAAAYLAGGDPPPPLSAEGLQVIRHDLDARWRHYQAGQTAAIEQLAAIDAERLIRALREAPASSALYRPLATVATEAAMLAGAIASDQGDRLSAAHWHAASTRAATKARSADLVCLTLEDQAWVADFSGQSHNALGLLSQMPVKRASPAAVARVELGRAGLLAPAGNARAALAALNEAASAADRAQEEPSLLPRPPVTDDRLARFRGYILVDLGIESGYKELKPALRHPECTDRNKGIIHVYLARAAAQAGAIGRACWHASTAHRLFVTLGATGQLIRVRRLRGDELAPFASARPVRELDEELRSGVTSRYKLCMTEDHKTLKAHQSTCRYVRRGRARSWHAAEQLDPIEAAAAAAEAGYELCKRCMPV